MSKWISVKDKLPDKSGRYLVIRDEDYYLLICKFYLENKKWDDGMGNVTDIITHWMKLPDPPEEE